MSRSRVGRTPGCTASVVARTSTGISRTQSTEAVGRCCTRVRPVGHPCTWASRVQATSGSACSVIHFAVHRRRSRGVQATSTDSRFGTGAKAAGLPESIGLVWISLVWTPPSCLAFTFRQICSLGWTRCVTTRYQWESPSSSRRRRLSGQRNEAGTYGNGRLEQARGEAREPSTDLRPLSRSRLTAFSPMSALSDERQGSAWTLLCATERRKSRPPTQSFRVMAAGTS